MNYEIRLSEMEFHAYHGCYDLEQQVGNRFCVELSLMTELGEVAAEDCVEKAVNYLDVYQAVARQMQIKQRTIERVAMNIITAIKTEFPAVSGVRCTVSKLAPPLGGKIGKVSVTLEG
ncbi:MAG: dihydroneopterin aldolase [Rikenellaceae bacterium]|nr:dihydroneopterin aldolase [Rikenellaceae bacterium]MBQ3261008.1 dihydroneopterin aldolase [Alistipes sp.]MBQ7342082.1 dihydroneopterin aldolase [Alistipes sp.]